MRIKLISAAALACCSMVVVLLAQGIGRAQPGVLKLQAQLIWGTNDDKSPNPSHRPVEADVKKKLKDLPLKWNHYFEVNRKNFDVPLSEIKKVPLSQKCELEVKNLGKSSVEVSLFGKGAKVLKRTQTLPRGETLVLGGSAPNATSWLVVLKRLE